MKSSRIYMFRTAEWMGRRSRHLLPRLQPKTGPRVKRKQKPSAVFLTYTSKLRYAHVWVRPPTQIKYWKTDLKTKDSKAFLLERITAFNQQILNSLGASLHYRKSPIWFDTIYTPLGRGNTKRKTTSITLACGCVNRGQSWLLIHMWELKPLWTALALSWAG